MTPGQEAPCGGGAGLFLVHSEFEGVGRGVPPARPGWICTAGEVIRSQFESPEHVWGEGREREESREENTHGKLSVLREVRIHLMSDPAGFHNYSDEPFQ